MNYTDRDIIVVIMTKFYLKKKLNFNFVFKIGQISRSKIEQISQSPT